MSLAGCVAYQPKPLDPAQLAHSFELRSLSDAALHAYIEQQSGQPPVSWPLARWNRQQLTLAAGFYNPALAAALARQQAAQGTVVTAGARPNPSLQFPFEYTLNNQGEGRPFSTGPALTWGLEMAGRRAARIDQAGALADARRLNMIDDAWKIRSEVRAALLGVFTGIRKAALLVDKQTLLKNGVDMLTRRLVAGSASMPEVRRAQLLLSQTEAEHAVARTILHDARMRLATAIGIPVAALDGIEFDFTEFEHVPVAPALAYARRSAILYRADLRAALAEYEAGQAALRQEIARQYPDIQLGAGYTYDNGANKISFGLAGLTLPMFDRNRGPIAQADARRTELAARVEALQENILNEIDNTLVRYRERGQALERAALQAGIAGRQRDSQRANFSAGLADRLDLTAARADFQTVALGYLNAVVALQEVAGQIEDLIQQPLPAAQAPLALYLLESAQ